MPCITEKRGRLVIDFQDQHGKLRLKTLTEETRKKDARKILHETLKQVERGTYLPDKKILNFKEVADQWLEKGAFLHKRDNRYLRSPYENYQSEVCKEAQ